MIVAAKRQEDTMPEHNAGSSPPKMRVNVLLVEDDQDDAYIVKNMLKSDKRRAFRITQCERVGEAAALLETKPFDIVLLDLGLSDSQGLSTLKSLMSTDISTPMLVLTGIDDDLFGEKVIQLGAEDYLPKSLLSPLLLSRSIVHAIERHQLLMEIRKKAEEDPLTGLSNRWALHNNLRHLIEQCERNDAKFALALLDLNDFKMINDELGHLAGDNLLVSIGKRLKQQLRKSDMVCRYGGDEFLLLLVNYRDEATLMEIMEEKNRVLSEPHVIDVDGDTITISVGVSIGLAEWSQGMAVSELLNRADEAMYRAKSNGGTAIHIG